ncbi:hypothetical protein IQ06DRAFT_341882 [Phaeosphaeriaceae sp. SRC1lsM3a]|nr:hypothetical protein IQ06DRAFT_341882 [Stagonospora sp. SRC1lsM3a]
MQYSIVALTALFAAALGAPSVEVTPRQAAFTQLGVWSISGCRDGSFVQNVAITNVATCQNLPAGITAGKIQTSLPAGCSLEFHVGAGCTSAQTITIPRDQQPFNCFEPGQGKTLGSVLVSGTCA